MELRQIRHFLAVAETGSFTKASERVSISQPALSASIAKLEAEFQVRLLDRSRSSVIPTLAGRRLLERAGAILSACNSVRAEVKNAAQPQPLRIGVLRTLSTRPIATLINNFRTLRPEVGFFLHEGTCDDLRRRLLDKRLDAIITTSEGPLPEDIGSRALFKETFVLAVATNHRFAREGSIKLSALDGEPLISRSGCETFQATIKEFAERKIKIRVAYKTDQDDRAVALAAAGVGVAMIPQLYDMPGIVQLRMSDFNVVRSFHIQWLLEEHSELPHDGQVQDFIRVASSHNWTARTHPGIGAESVKRSRLTQELPKQTARELA